MSRAIRLSSGLLLALTLARPAGAGADASVTEHAVIVPPALDRPLLEDVSRLGVRRADAAGTPETWLAQRTIDREWGLSEDSVYVERDVPGWRSEPMAAAFSLALPGTGQLYASEGRAWLYAAAEVAGWGGWWWYRHEAEKLGNDAVDLAGSPDVASSGWSFDRWVGSGQDDADAIAALYRADREAFYNRIATDPAYLPGWVNPSTRNEFSTLRVRSDQRLSRSRTFSAGLWINHLVSAMNALRAARHHNMNLRPSLGLELRGRMDRRGAGMAVVLERTF